MLMPIYLGIAGQIDPAAADPASNHAVAHTLMSNNVVTAFIVAMAHTVAMTLSGAVLAIVAYVWLGLKFISKCWFNLDLAWALTLILV